MKTAADKDPSNNLKSNMLILGFKFWETCKNHQVALLLEHLEKTYKSNDYSTTFTASRVAWVAKGWDNTEELAFGSFLR
jgi:hypothetical protein